MEIKLPNFLKYSSGFEHLTYKQAIKLPNFLKYSSGFEHLTYKQATDVPLTP
jgi:hypothetical protein